MKDHTARYATQSSRLVTQDIIAEDVVAVHAINAPHIRNSYQGEIETSTEFATIATLKYKTLW